MSANFGVDMKRSSKYFELRYIVQAKMSPNVFYLTIAAFDSDGIARDYATTARTSSANRITQIEYRVAKRNSRGQFKTIFAPE